MSEQAWHDELPSIHELGAACWVARLFARAQSMTPVQSRSAYGRAATDGLFRQADLLLGESLLCAAGLVDLTEGMLVGEPEFLAATDLADGALRELILERLMAKTHPLWISAAVSPTSVDESLVPDAIAADLAAIFPDPKRREAFLLAMGHRFDDAERRRVGELAEEHVVAECRAELQAANTAALAKRVRQVSLVSDQLGYDVVAPRCDGSDRRLEVKGTRATGSLLSITISRNEANVGLRDSDWSLAVCRVGQDDETEVIGWLDGTRLKPHLPSDPDHGGAWDAAVVYLDQSDLTPGLPPC